MKSLDHTWLKNMFIFNIIRFSRELGRKKRETLQKMAEIANEGFLLKQQLIHEAKRGLEEKKVWMQ